MACGQAIAGWDGFWFTTDSGFSDWADTVVDDCGQHHAIDLATGLPYDGWTPLGGWDYAPGRLPRAKAPEQAKPAPKGAGTASTGTTKKHQASSDTTLGATEGSGGGGGLVVGALVLFLAWKLLG